MPRHGAVRWSELLELVALTDRAATLAGELAHGQKQWLEIGMALAIEPRLFLLDEPTAGMTPQETLATAEMLLRLRANSRSWRSNMTSASCGR